SLKVLGVNDLGYLYGAGIAHRRALESLKLAGHEVHVVALADEPSPLAANPCGAYAFPYIQTHATAERYDLILAGNIHAATRSADLLARLSLRTPVAAVLHDFFLLTGRCAQPDSCRKYLTRCDSSCPTPTEHPALEPSWIAYEHGVKRSWLNSEVAPLFFVT